MYYRSSICKRSEGLVQSDQSFELGTLVTESQCESKKTQMNTISNLFYLYLSVHIFLLDMNKVLHVLIIL